jgi:hypothetical protein
MTRKRVSHLRGLQPILILRNHLSTERELGQPVGVDRGNGTLFWHLRSTLYCRLGSGWSPYNRKGKVTYTGNHRIADPFSTSKLTEMQMLGSMLVRTVN